MTQKLRVQDKDVTLAIAKGLKELGLRRDQVEVTVLEAPKKGFLGIGSKPAVVELRKKRWNTGDLDSQIYMDVPKKRRSSRTSGRKSKYGEARSSRRRSGERRPQREKLPKANEPQLLPSEAIQHAVIPEKLQQPMQEAKEHLLQVLTQMGVKVENLNVWWDEKQQRILLTFDCDKPAIVIGKEGKTLEAIQYLSTLALSRHFDTPISVIADTQNYWRKTEDKINAEIEKGVDLIKHGHSVFRFRPMGAQLRRYIHRALEGNEFVTTASEGEGKWRKVTFRPTEKVAEFLAQNKAPADFVPGVIGEDIPQPEPTQEQPAQPEQTPVVVTQVTTEQIVVETSTHVVVEEKVDVAVSSPEQRKETPAAETQPTSDAQNPAPAEENK